MQELSLGPGASPTRVLREIRNAWKDIMEETEEGTPKHVEAKAMYEKFAIQVKEMEEMTAGTRPIPPELKYLFQ